MSTFGSALATKRSLPHAYVRIFITLDIFISAGARVNRGMSLGTVFQIHEVSNNSSFLRHVLYAVKEG